MKGILLVNLGTPNSPNPKDVFRYLIEFLTDGRVIDIPWWKRQLLVRGIIVPFRYRNSAKSYREIWMKEGSPLMVWGRRVQSLLQCSLGDGYLVELAMRYQNPSIEAGLERLKHLDEITILPLFPQYASATTGSIHQEVMRVVSKWEVIPKMQMINSYPTDEKMVAAYADQARKFPIENYDAVLMSFHGLPKRHLIKADCNNVCQRSEGCCSKWAEKNRNCYAAQCYATADAIKRKLDLDKVYVCFQSRLGSDPWIGPFTSDVLKELRRQGKKRVLVFCPAFVCDCLETIYEIGIEYKHEFLEAGGEQLDLVPSLNDHPLWIESLVERITLSSPSIPEFQRESSARDLCSTYR